MSLNTSWWSRFFWLAAFFNYAMGFPILLAREWSFNFVYLPAAGRDAMALRLWADFGFAVVLIGFGYQLVAYDVTKNRGIVLLGVGAKLFDVINLSYLYYAGLAKSIVLLPAAIDFTFTVFFVIFLFLTAPHRAAARAAA